MFLRRNEITFEAAIADLKEPRWQARARAAGALATCDAADRDVACHALRQVLSDPRGEVRYAAVHSLGELGDREAVQAIRDLVLDADPLVRQAAIVALGRIGDKEGAWESLVRALREGEAEARFHAVGALSALDAALAEPHLIAALRDGDAQVRANAACALSEAPPSEAGTQALIDLLSDPDVDVRFEAALTLASRGERRAVPALLSFIEDRQRAPLAVEALGPLRDPRTRVPLLGVLGRYFAAPLTKVHAARALMLQDVPEGRAALERLSRSLRPEVSSLARQILEGTLPVSPQAS